MSRLNNYPVLSLSECKQVDLKMSELYHYPPLLLMEEAAHAIYHQLHSDFPHLKDHSIAVLAGNGNNGGDAVALTRLLSRNRYRVTCYLIEDKDGSDLFLQEKQYATPFYTDFRTFREFIAEAGNFDLIIDAIFGIGYRHRENKDFTAVTNAINTQSAPVVAIDIPSGLTPENPHPVRAHHTYSIGFAKLPMYTQELRSKCGKITILPISFKDDVITPQLDATLITHRTWSLDVSQFTHKYSRGGALIAGGSPGMFGSVTFSAKASLAVGSGIIRIITRPQWILPVQELAGEIISSDYTFTKQLPSSYTTLLIGPGLTEIDSDEKTTLHSLLSRPNNIVLDASFFTHFTPTDLPQTETPLILTPHRGEFNRFFNGIHEDLPYHHRISQIARDYNIYLLVKDSFLILGTPQGKLLIYDFPMRKAAQAGSGDLLSGIIAGLLSQDLLSPVDTISAAIMIFYHTLTTLPAFQSYRPLDFLNQLPVSTSAILFDNGADCEKKGD